VCPGDLVEHLEQLCATTVEVSAGAFSSFRVDGRLAQAVLAGQEALGQRVVGEHGELPSVGDR
jgi:hypothetical protein